MSDLEGIEANLTRDEAARRRARVGDADYELYLDLVKGSEEFSGRTRIRFELRPGDGEVFVDFIATHMDSAELNGEAVPAERWNRTRLTLPEELLREGENTLEVAYRGKYGRTGTGFHRFVDPEDGGEYVYSNLEPYDAHRVFPCFDQPDIKATYRLEVHAPTDWEVISNYREELVEEAGDERNRWVFPPGARYSTYLFNVTAGPYEKWEDEQARIPARIFARPTQAKFADPEAVFETTRRGFDFYEKYFETPYPFEKYDQVFAPEFMTGAMENVGAVLINDMRYLFRHHPSLDDRIERAMVVLHEMAHMWFGNLVTMRWWDGLWLNESFATYMSFLALDGATDFETGWVYFDQKIRSWAVWQDELPTTHAIDLDVPETQGCFSNFDGITYGKGCCVLKQLAHRIGEETFRKGVARYLQDYSWKNTSNHDFLQSLADEAGMDLDPWAERWLFSSGVNTIRTELVGDAEAPTRLRFTQEPGNGDAVLRSHKVRVALFHENEAGELHAEDMDVLIDGAVTEVDLPEMPSPPVLVHPNVGGDGYFKLDLDRSSLVFLEEGLYRLWSDNVRSSLVDVTRQMVRDAEIHPVDYLRGVHNELNHERFPGILESFSSFVPVVLMSYLEPEHRAVLAPRFDLQAREHLENPELGPEEKAPWFRIFVGSSFDEHDLHELEEVLDGEMVFPGLDIDARRRWSMLARLVWAKHPGALDRLASEETSDTSDVGKLRALEIRASVPSEAAKAEIWNRFLNDSSLSLEMLKAGYAGFHKPGQETLLAPYTERYLEALPRVDKERNTFQSVAFAKGLFPRYDESEELEEKVRALLDGDVGLQAGAVRALKEGLDDTLRWRRIRAKARRPRVID